MVYCECVCIYVDTKMCMCRYAWTHVCGDLRLMWGVFFHVFLPLSLRHGLPFEFKPSWYYLSTVSAFRVSVGIIMDLKAYPCIYVLSGDQKSNSHVYVTSVLSTESPSQPWMFSLLDPSLLYECRLLTTLVFPEHFRWDTQFPFILLIYHCPIKMPAWDLQVSTKFLAVKLQYSWWILTLKGNL